MWGRERRGLPDSRSFRPFSRSAPACRSDYEEEAMSGALADRLRWCRSAEVDTFPRLSFTCTKLSSTFTASTQVGNGDRAVTPHGLESSKGVNPTCASQFGQHQVSLSCCLRRAWARSLVPNLPQDRSMTTYLAARPALDASNQSISGIATLLRRKRRLEHWRVSVKLASLNGG